MTWLNSRILVSLKEVYIKFINLIGIKKENLGYLKTSFLSFMIAIKDQTFCTKSFATRESFPFSIICISYLNSNTPWKIVYSAFRAEILRSVRTANYATIFERNTQIFTIRMMKQGCNKLLGLYFDVFCKYNITSLESAELLMN